MFHILHNKPQTPVACHYLLHLFPLRRISAYGNCNESQIVTALVGKLEKLSEPGLTMKCGAENSTARVAIIVNKVKIIRHKRSTTMAANFQSRVMSLVSSSFFSWENGKSNESVDFIKVSPLFLRRCHTGVLKSLIKMSESMQQVKCITREDIQFFTAYF